MYQQGTFLYLVWHLLVDIFNLRQMQFDNVACRAWWNSSNMEITLINTPSDFSSKILSWKNLCVDFWEVVKSPLRLWISTQFLRWS